MSNICLTIATSNNSTLPLAEQSHKTFLIQLPQHPYQAQAKNKHQAAGAQVSAWLPACSQFFQPWWPSSKVFMAPCRIYPSTSNRAFPGCFWVSPPLGRASLRARMPHSPLFLWEMFFAQGPWLISYRKFLACSLHTERKLIAQKLCLVTKDVSDDSRVSGRKTPAAPWGGRALVWPGLHRIVGQAGSARGGCLPCSSISLNLSLLICQVLWTLHWASHLNLPSSKCYCEFVSFPLHQIVNLSWLALRKRVTGYTKPHVALHGLCYRRWLSFIHLFFQTMNVKVFIIRAYCTRFWDTMPNLFFTLMELTKRFVWSTGQTIKQAITPQHKKEEGQCAWKHLTETSNLL